MVEDLIKKLLEAGVHFGHQTDRWNPKMKRFIFGQRSSIYIIDWFLWYMAGRGYTLQKSRKKVNFREFEDWRQMVTLPPIAQKTTNKVE